MRLIVECRVIASLILKVEGFSTDTTDAEAMDYAVRSQDVPLDETNIGNKLLKSMGWTEGRGIGKNNQGMGFSEVLEGFFLLLKSFIFSSGHSLSAKGFCSETLVFLVK